MKTLGLALGAGGMRGGCHIGVLKAFVENGLRPDFIAGTSMGAVVGGAYAATLDIARIEEIARSVSRRDVMDIAVLRSRHGLLAGNKAERLLSKFTGGVDASETKIPFCCVTADLITAQKIVLDSGALHKNIRASMSVPFVFEPVRMDGKLLVDGGIIDRVPVSECLKLGAQIVVAVDALGPPNFYEPRSRIGTLLRIIRIMEYSLSKFREDRKLENLLITPDMPEIKEHHVSDLAKAIDIGYETGLKYVERVKELLL